MCLFIHLFLPPLITYVLGARVKTANDPCGFSSPAGKLIITSGLSLRKGEEDSVVFFFF